VECTFWWFGLIAFTSTYAAASRLEIPKISTNETMGQTREPSGRIAYGQRVTSASQFPFMARLAWVSGNRVKTDCGGTVISPYHILTAAHCLFNPESMYYTWDGFAEYDPPNLILLGGTNTAT